MDEGVETDNVVLARDAVTLDTAKNEVGYIKVMVPEAERPPPAEGVNLRYAVQPDLPASRSEEFMVKLKSITLSPMWPDAMSVGLSLASAVVWMDIEVAPAGTAPMVSPLSVTVTAVLTANDEAVSVSTIAVVVGSALVAVTAPPLSAAVGVDDIAKKPLG